MTKLMQLLGFSLFMVVASCAGSYRLNGKGDDLLEAVDNKDLVSVQKYLKNGVNPNFVDGWGMTGLMAAAQSGYLDIVKAFLKAKANPNLPYGEDRETPLIAAAMSGYTEVVRVLLSAKPKAKPNLANENGDTALMKAASRGHIEIVEILLSAKAKPNLANKNGDTALDIVESRKLVEIANILKSVSS